MLSGSTGSEFQIKQVLLKIRLFGKAKFDLENLTLFRPLAQHSSVLFDVSKHFTTVTTFFLQFQREGLGSGLAETSRCLSRSRPFLERHAQRHHIIIIRDFEQVDNAASVVTSRRQKNKKTEREGERERESFRPRSYSPWARYRNPPPPPSPSPPGGIFGDNDFWIAQYVSFQYQLVCKVNYSAFIDYLRWYIAA